MLVITHNIQSIVSYLFSIVTYLANIAVDIIIFGIYTNIIINEKFQIKASYILEAR